MVFGCGVEGVWAKADLRQAARRRQPAIQSSLLKGINGIRGKTERFGEASLQ
jgi:hypothetical protein